MLLRHVIKYYAMTCRQEGVHLGYYKAIEVRVEPSDGPPPPPRRDWLQCRTYYLLMREAEDKRPSPQYLEVIIRGALQHGLPGAYVDKLRSIQHNGYSGQIGIKVDMPQITGV